MTKTRLFAILSIILFLFIGFQACKKNKNEEISYQRQAFAAQNLLLQKHNIIQLTVSYFKTLTNEELANTSSAIIDSGAVSVIMTNGKLNYKTNYSIKSDNYLRFREGDVLIETDTLPLQDGAQSSMTFTNFNFYTSKAYPPNSFTATSLNLELLSTADGHYIFEQQVINAQYTDTSGTKIITLNGTIHYDWEKWPENEWFSCENEIIRIEADLILTNSNGDIAKLSTSNPFTFNPRCDIFDGKNCGIVEGGSGSFSFPGLIPEIAEMNYPSVDTVCNKGGRMQMEGLTFFLTINDWMPH